MFDIKSILSILIVLILLVIIIQFVISTIIVGYTRKLTENLSNNMVKKYTNLLSGLFKIPKFAIITETINEGYKLIVQDKHIDKKLKNELKTVLVKRNLLQK